MMRPYVQPLSTPCSRLARLPVLNPGNGWKTSWCACLPIMVTSERYSHATGRKSQRLAASSIQLSESGSNLPELRKSCCHLHITPCHLYVLRRMLTFSCRWPSYRPAGATFPLQTVPVEGPSLMRRAGESPSISTTIPISGGCHPFVFGMAQKINAPQVCCLATRLRGSLGSTVQK